MLDIVRATSIQQIGEASALRYEVYLRAMPPRGIANSARREITPYDVLGRTHHLIAYDGAEAVGTLCVILPTTLGANDSDTRYGLSMEDSVAFLSIPAGVKICEIGRLAIRPDYRRTEVVRLVFKELYKILIENEIDYLGGLSLTDKNNIAEADRSFDIIQRGGWYTDQIWVSPVKVQSPSFDRAPAGATPASGELVETEEFGTLPALVRYYLRAGFRVCGRPFYDQHYDRCFFPMIAKPSDLLSGRFAGRTIMDP